MAQVQDSESKKIFPSTLRDYLLGDMVVCSDEERALKIILYQCEAQAHAYALWAFSSTDGESIQYFVIV